MENNEYIDFLKDYKECLNRISGFEYYAYKDTVKWATEKYIEWASKDPKYVLSITGGSNCPISDKEKALNAINNFKTTLDKIAIINNINI